MTGLRPGVSRLTYLGIGSFALGSILLLVSSAVSPLAVLAIVLLVATATLALAGAARRARSWPIATGREALIGSRATSSLL